MKQGPFLAIGRLISFTDKGLEENESQHTERLEHGQSTWGWCIASALKATKRASKSSWFPSCSSCFRVWPFVELLDEGCSFSDLVCMLCSALGGGIVRKNLEHTVAWDKGRWQQILPALWAFLAQQPRALQKPARLLATMQKRILGQRPAVGTRCTMLNTLNTQTSHAQRLKQQICSLWSSILMSKSLPVVTLVWRAVMARVSPKT